MTDPYDRDLIYCNSKIFFKDYFLRNWSCWTLNKKWPAKLLMIVAMILWEWESIHMSPDHPMKLEERPNFFLCLVGMLWEWALFLRFVNLLDSIEMIFNNLGLWTGCCWKTWRLEGSGIVTDFKFGVQRWARWLYHHSWRGSRNQQEQSKCISIIRQRYFGCHPCWINLLHLAF